MSEDLSYTNAVREYYDKSQKWYSWFYSDRESLALHYGFWKKGTRTRREALLNQYREIINLIRPRAGDEILDVGCGVGGASLWLAKHTAANYTGITLSSVQLRLAKRYAAMRGLTHRTKFYGMDYLHTSFKDAAFDKIFAIESFCHSYPDPTAAFREMYRILKPNGKFVIADGILARHPNDAKEQKLAALFCKGFAMKGWNTMREIVAALAASGFRGIRFFNKRREIKRTVRDIYLRGLALTPLALLLRLLRVVSKAEARNILGTYSQKKMYDCGLFGYGVFYAEK